MQQYKKLIIKLLEKEEVHTLFLCLTKYVEHLNDDQLELVLEKIEAIVTDDSLSDTEYVEEIIRLLEQNPGAP